MKKMMLAVAVLSFMSGSALAADAGSGEVKFSGSIVTAPCSIAPNDESKEIPLGQISNVTLESGGLSSEQQFSIKLVGCSLNAEYTGVDAQGLPVKKTYNNTVNIRFTGTEWVNGSTNTGLLQITGEGQGAGVKLMTDSGTQVLLNNNTVRTFVAGDNVLRFKAALQGIQGTPVTPGKFDATTNFILSYN